MPHDHMPTRLTTTLDDIDFDGLVKRLRRVRDDLKGCLRTGGGSRTQASFSNMRGAYVSFRRTTDGMMVMEASPSADARDMRMVEEPLPDHGSMEAPIDGPAAVAIVSRWLAMLSLPRYRTWPNQNRGDDPYHAHSDAAGSLLAALNPRAIGRYVRMDVPSQYDENRTVTMLDRPVFAKPIAERLCSAVPVTAKVSDDGARQYLIGAPDRVDGYCEEPDVVGRLRMLADVADIRKPLLKAGLEAGG